MKNFIQRRFTLPANDLFHDHVYRRLWSSILISSFGAQITMLALPLTAAVMLHASATQMGLLTFMETLPFVLLSLPSGVWLDRVRKLPVYVAGESLIALAVLSVPLAWWLGWVGMGWLYMVGFLIGCVNTVAGTAAQIVLTQIVPRERLVEAHAKNALASSGAEVAGPAMAGALIKILGAPIALIADALLLLSSAVILRGIRVQETTPARSDSHFWGDLKAGVQFVAHKPLLIALACTVGAWQFFYNAALVVQILFATRVLGLSEQAVGLSYMGMGMGTIVASLFGYRISRQLGPGPCMVLGIGLCGLGWSLAAVAPADGRGIAVFGFMLMCFATGGVLIFINFLALRQAVTPAPLLGRMTSTMRWLILIPAGPGALAGGWIGQYAGLRAALGFAGGGALLLALIAWHHPAIRSIRVLPELKSDPEMPQN
ncbi:MULTISPECIES: MFS transporter [unclassified Undibacterium]|uniref:MFS transporter n=1 Tax=unclassified Undibacterium TaxID=2630295 RepID=UPI002AC8E7DA|nr:MULTISPECIES: MFS transporter [unclassified Undibacterium]MEB0138775.1 MFS transporter [Undibacterium sp. CCC2.1]MEB0170749.1 MFS transporter [Undibacterium sp. CCC1.1]MEB0174638.1 MFS transporter [Undibacterium sp. CCC3.4]MEB0213835.1 MFS transporter [Undibacterium sp. 5I2]WPX42561.1 MFS transporter [Undibacterium sp. CCC3.4]